MPGAVYAEVAQRLREAGLPEDLPCVIVSNASGTQQEIRWTSVAALGDQENLPAPALLIVGRVAAHRVQEVSAAYWRGAAPPRQAPHPKVS
jgi:siroheme synthase